MRVLNAFVNPLLNSSQLISIVNHENVIKLIFFGVFGMRWVELCFIDVSLL